MSKTRNQLLATAAGALLAVGASNAAFAANPTFTFDPSQVDAALTGTAITANQLVINSDSLTTFSPAAGVAGSTFSESGVVQIIGYGGVSSGNANLMNNGSQPPIPGSTYQLFLNFTSTGSAGTVGACGADTCLTYTLTAFNFTLKLDEGTADTIPTSANNTLATPTISGGDTLKQLATGSLLVGSVTEDLTLGTFTEGFHAALDTSAADGNQPGFFVSPNPFFNISLNSITSASATNSSGSPTNEVLINGQQGNVTFATVVPEPASMAIFGTALIGLGWARRRKNGKKA